MAHRKLCKQQGNGTDSTNANNNKYGRRHIARTKEYLIELFYLIPLHSYGLLYDQSCRLSKMN